MIIKVPSTLREHVLANGIPVASNPEPGLEGATFEIDLRLIEEAQHDRLYELLKVVEGSRSIRVQMNAFKKAKEEGLDGGVSNLQIFASKLAEYIVKEAKEGWIFKVDDNPIPALVTNVYFTPAIRRRDHEAPAYVTVNLMQNLKGEVHSLSATFFDNDIRGVSIPQALREKGWTKETDELHELYQEELARYKEIRGLFGKQLRLRTSRKYDPEEDRYRYHYGRRERPKTEVDLQSDNGGRLIHDDPIPEANLRVSTYRRNDPDNPALAPAFAQLVETKLGKETKAFTRAPFHMVLSTYHLGQHQNIEVHVREVEIYQYDKKMRDKLVLPGLYGEVLDVLTTDMLLVQDDIIEGKSGGNVILLAGPPGTGKTLTAEVYAEFREVPLLKIHSGQLGTSADAVEKNLLTFYQRASKWGVPVLLDEFDVFGRARGDNLHQNAVVAVFLRTLEYQSNTIFLTTNRHTDMDDAILSRCAAIVRYEYPELDELHEIWKVQRDLLLPGIVSDEMVDSVMEYFKEHLKQMSGRDVKNILQLAQRYHKAGREITSDLLLVCSSFRGV